MRRLSKFKIWQKWGNSTRRLSWSSCNSALRVSGLPRESCRLPKYQFGHFSDSQDQKLVILISSSVHLRMTQNDFNNFSSKRWNLAGGEMWWLIKSLCSSKWFSRYLACSRFWGDNQIPNGANISGGEEQRNWHEGGCGAVRGVLWHAIRAIQVASSSSKWVTQAGSALHV